MNNYYQVAVNFPGKDCVFTYKTQKFFSKGELVDVPFGRGSRIAKGAILEESSVEEKKLVDENKIKPIFGMVDNSFRLNNIEMALYEWMSKYYHYSLGKLIFDCLPKILKRPRKIEFIKGLGHELPFDLSEKQELIFSDIKSHLNEGFTQNYIHGVTGSGKSAIYINLIKECLVQGKSVQFLLPEINLTPQFTEMFKEFLNCSILTYHSAVTPSEKYNIWKALNESGEAVLVMGVRSSIFLPLSNLGLIIIDEEHDASFKQNDRCPYNGRDVAIKKAQLSNCAVVLGSATPTVENFFQFSTHKNDRYYYELKERVGDGQFPNLIIRDTRDRFSEIDEAWPFLDETLKDIQNKLDKKEQVLIFINKLGYSSYIQCRNCGHQFINEKCGCRNSLRYFKKKNCLSCSYCDFIMPMPDKCPECAGISLLNKGFGTEKVEQVLKAIFPMVNIERFDRDEIQTTKDLKKKLDRFHNHKIDILVGTQMLAKGHNFKKVNLVVILGIDSMLNYADFRSSEKTYQLVEQVTGRAGRYSDDSQVIIQTMTPEHPVFKFVEKHSFDEFYSEELNLRKLCYCPPYTKMAMIYFSSRFREKVIKEIQMATNSLNVIILRQFTSVRLLGPAPMGIEKKANQFTWAFMLKSDNLNELHQVIRTFDLNYQKVSNVSYKIDMDPMQIL